MLNRNELDTLIKHGVISKPTRYFNVGDSVKIGHLENVTITEVLHDGYAYAIHYDYMGESYGKPSRKVGDGLWEWNDVFPMSAFNQDTNKFGKKDEYRIRYINNDISSLIHKVSQGVNFNPEYQRDLVWSNEQKVALIDSIFNNVDIGKFTFIVNPYNSTNPLHYEIIDGKQRLTTIMDFYEDRFEYKGKKFSELHVSDTNHFLRHPIVQGEIEGLTEQGKYQLFLKLNTTGIPVAQEHLDKVRKLLN